MKVQDYKPEDTTILIVDDKEPNRELLHDRLSREGYDLVLAENGEEALVLAEGMSVDLILLDVMMPDMDGFEVCRRLRANPDTREIPVIMVTALSDKASRLSGLEVGADEFLSKPVDLFELDARVKNLTRLGRYRKLMGERAKFEVFARVSSDACVVTDDTGEIRYHNRRAQEFLPGLAVGKKLALTVRYPGANVLPRGGWDGDLPNQESVNLVFRHESGRLRWLELTERFIEPPIPNEHLFTLSDVTASVEKKKAAWSFHSVLAHKFRTPLTGIIGTLELLELDLDEEQQPLLEGLTASARRLGRQVEAVLKYVEGPDRLTGAPTAVGRLPELFARLAEESRIAVRDCAAAADLDTHAVGISEQGWVAVFTELLGNSRKFSPDGEPHVELSINRDDEQCQISYRDHGAAIPPDKLDRVGSPYFQAEDYFTGETPGMGLGLSMIGALAAEAGGRLTVENCDDGPGVRVTLLLPFSDPESDVGEED